MANTKVNYGMTAKDLFNAKHASKDVKEAIDSGEVLTVTGCAIVAEGGTDRNGQPCDVGYIATNDGVFGFISSILLSSIPDLAEILESGEPIDIRFFAGVAKNGSEYYSFMIV